MTANQFGVTRADVAHLRAGMDAVIEFTDSDDRTFTISGPLFYGISDRNDLLIGAEDIVRWDDDPHPHVSRVISPKPPQREPGWYLILTDRGNSLACHFDGTGWSASAASGHERREPGGDVVTRLIPETDTPPVPSLREQLGLTDAEVRRALLWASESEDSVHPHGNCLIKLGRALREQETSR